MSMDASGGMAAAAGGHVRAPFLTSIHVIALVLQGPERRCQPMFGCVR